MTTLSDAQNRYMYVQRVSAVSNRFIWRVFQIRKTHRRQCKMSSSVLPPVAHLPFSLVQLSSLSCGVLLETIFCRSFTLYIWPDSEPTKLLDHHPKQNHRRGGGPQTDKHLPQSPFTCKYFQMTTFCIAFYELYFSNGLCNRTQLIYVNSFVSF